MDIAWSSEIYSPIQLLQSSVGFPALVKITRGNRGENQVDTVYNNQIFRIHSIVLQERVLIQDRKKRLLSLPLDWPLKFKVKKNVFQRSKRMLLVDIAQDFVLPVQAYFDKIPSWRFTVGRKEFSNLKFGRVQILERFPEYFFKGNFISDAHGLDETIALLPLYLDVDLRVAEGLRTGSHDDWVKMLRSYDQAAVKIDFEMCKGVIDLLRTNSNNTKKSAALHGIIRTKPHLMLKTTLVNVESKNHTEARYVKNQDQAKSGERWQSGHRDVQQVMVDMGAENTKVEVEEDFNGNKSRKKQDVLVHNTSDSVHVGGFAVDSSGQHQRVEPGNVSVVIPNHSHVTNTQQRFQLQGTDSVDRATDVYAVSNPERNTRPQSTEVMHNDYTSRVIIQTFDDVQVSNQDVAWEAPARPQPALKENIIPVGQSSKQRSDYGLAYELSGGERVRRYGSYDDGLDEPPLSARTTPPSSVRYVVKPLGRPRSGVYTSSQSSERDYHRQQEDFNDRMSTKSDFYPSFASHNSMPNYYSRRNVLSGVQPINDYRSRASISQLHQPSTYRPSSHRPFHQQRQNQLHIDIPEEQGGWSYDRGYSTDDYDSSNTWRYVNRNSGWKSSTAPKYNYHHHGPSRVQDDYHHHGPSRVQHDYRHHGPSRVQDDYHHHGPSRVQDNCVISTENF